MIRPCPAVCTGVMTGVPQSALHSSSLCPIFQMLRAVVECSTGAGVYAEYVVGALLAGLEDLLACARFDPTPHCTLSGFALIKGTRLLGGHSPTSTPPERKRASFVVRSSLLPLPPLQYTTLHHQPKGKYHRGLENRHWRLLLIPFTNDSPRPIR